MTPSSLLSLGERELDRRFTLREGEWRHSLSLRKGTPNLPSLSAVLSTRSFARQLPVVLSFALVLLVTGMTGPLIAQSDPAAGAAATEVTAPLVREAPIPTKNLLEVIRDGGPLMVPIGVCSFALLVFVFERAISLRKGRVIPGHFVRRLLQQLREQQLDRDKAVKLCADNHSSVAEVFGAALRKWGRPAVEVEQAIIDAGERVTNVLRRYLRLFNGISTISPLLGLLGTVLGMIRAFNAIATADAMGRPELLAAGISQALLTTAAGLSVAIPALIAHLFFAGRVDRLIMEIDSLGQQLVGLISAEANPKSSRKSKAA